MAWFGGSVRGAAAGVRLHNDDEPDLGDGGARTSRRVRRRAGDRARKVVNG
jgi:hypothetical protein